MRWKYMRTILGDGNFKQDHLKMKHPVDDIPLSDGHGFMVGSKDFDRYTSELGPEKPEVRLFSILIFRDLPLQSEIHLS